MASGRSDAPLVWIDCEMTGLNRHTDTIMSLCCFITDAQLNVLEPQGFERIIQHPQSVLDRMDEWCITTHGNSGLTAACLASSTSAESAAQDLLAYIRSFVPQLRTALLAGNSVHCDKEFLAKEPWAEVLGYLSYRILDVSSIKEAVRRWGSEEALSGVPRKKGLHQAREDVLESIEEARYYRAVLFRERNGR